MADINPTISIKNIKCDWSKQPNQKKETARQDQNQPTNQDPTMCCPQETNFSFIDINSLKIKGLIICHANSKPQES